MGTVLFIEEYKRMLWEKSKSREIMEVYWEEIANKTRMIGRICE